MDDVVKAFLSPGEYSSIKLVHVSTGDEATLSLDSSLLGNDSCVYLNPQRINWPLIQGAELRVEGVFKLGPAFKFNADEKLKQEFYLVWTLRPVGQRFTSDLQSYFLAEVDDVRVMSKKNDKLLFFWQSDEKPLVCTKNPPAGHPVCNLEGVSREIQSLAVDMRGNMAAAAIGGFLPRLEVYDLTDGPSLLWKAYFPPSGGGVIQTTFSSDERWVAALTAKGHLHRFDAATGGRHLTISSNGLTAKAVPPGDIMAVAGENGAVTLWYLKDGTIAWSLWPRSSRGAVDKLAVSGDGEKIATLEYSEEKTIVRIWSIRRRSILARVYVDGHEISDLALNTDGSTLYLSHGTDGLMVGEINKKRPDMILLKGSGAKQCLGKLKWESKTGSLICATSGNFYSVDKNGDKKNEYFTPFKSSDWILDVADSAAKVVATGGGHLMVW